MIMQYFIALLFLCTCYFYPLVNMYMYSFKKEDGGMWADITHILISASQNIPLSIHCTEYL